MIIHLRNARVLQGSLLARRDIAIEDGIIIGITASDGTGSSAGTGQSAGTGPSASRVPTGMGVPTDSGVPVVHSGGGCTVPIDATVNDARPCADHADRVGHADRSGHADAEFTIDASSLTLLPGFIDIHTHGATGVDFNNVTSEDVLHISAFFARCGVSCYLPTVLTDNVEQMVSQLDLLSSAGLLAANPAIGGIHLEGPFLSSQYKGAMPGHLLRNPDPDLLRAFQEAARGTIRLMTISPELPGAVDMIKQAVELGIKVSLGHTGASYETALQAFAAGALSATHTMNAMKLLHMHDPGIMTAVLEGDCYAEMICDGFHLQPPIIRLLLKAKGYDRMICMTDSLSAAGCPDGVYRLGVNMIEVKGGDAKLVESGIRAGSTLTMDLALRNLIAYTGKDITTLSPLVSTNASTMLGFSGVTGTLAVGKRADIVGLDASNTVQLTIVQGKVAYQGDVACQGAPHA